MKPSVLRIALPTIAVTLTCLNNSIAQAPSLKYDVEYMCNKERVVVRYCRNDRGQPVHESQNFCHVEFLDRPRRVAEIAVFASMLRSEIAVRLQSCSDPTAAGGTGSSGAKNTTSTAAVNQAVKRGQALIDAKDYTGAMVELKEALRLDPRHATAFYLVGVAQYNLKDYTVSNAAFERSLQLDASNPSGVYSWIGDCQRALGQPVKALSAYQESVRAKPEYADGFNKMGLIYFEQKEYANAAIFFNQAARLNPRSGLYRLNTGTAYLRLGKKDEAMKVYNALVPVDPKLANELLDAITKPATAATKPRTPAETNVDDGIRFYDAKEYQKALASYQEAMRLKPDYAEASHRLGMTHYQLKQYPQAIAAFENALKFKFANPHHSHDWIGDTYYEQKQYAKAIPAFKEAVRLKPDDANFFQKLGNANYRHTLYKDALAAYQAAIKLKPDNPVHHESAGDSYYALRQYDKAIGPYSETVRLDPKHDSAWNQMCVSHYFLKQYPAALTACEQAIKLKPDSALYLMNLGDTYFTMGRKEDALAVHKKLATMDKAKADELLGRINTSEANTVAAAALNKGLEFEKTKEYAKAIAEYQKAIAAKPNNVGLATAHHLLGSAYISLRDWPQATSNLLTAARLDPTYAVSQAELGYVYQRTLQFPKAITSYQEAIRLEKNDKVLASRLASLAKVYLLMGRRADAMQIYAKLQSADAPLAKTLLENIEEADKNGPAGVLVMYALSQEISGNSEDAVDIYQNALKLKPSPKVILDIADGLGGSGGKHEERLALFRQVLTLKASPEDRARAHHGIGLILIFMKQYEKAISEIREAQRLKPDAYYSYALGEAYTGLKQFPEALAAYQEAASLKTELWMAAQNKIRISETYVAMGQTDKAIAYLESVAQNVESTALNVSLELGKLYISSKRYPDAVTFLNKVIKVSPDYKEAYYELGKAYIAMGRKPDAMRTYVALRPINMELALKLLAEINKP